MGVLAADAHDSEGDDKEEYNGLKNKHGNSYRLLLRVNTWFVCAIVGNSL
jgi:hypothetical protein